MKKIKENINRMLNLMESQHGIVLPLINEQNSEYWNAVQGISNNPQGKKQVIKEIAASNPLTYPGKGSLIFVDKKTPIYVGVMIQAHNQPLVKPVESPNMALSAPFGYYLSFFLADEQDSKGYPNNKPHQADYFTVKCAKLKSGKFQILTMPSFTEQFKKQSMDTTKGGARASVELSLSMALKDLDGWMGSLRNDINAELGRMGFPALPNSLTWNGIQDVA